MKIDIFVKLSLLYCIVSSQFFFIDKMIIYFQCNPVSCVHHHDAIQINRIEGGGEEGEGERERGGWGKGGGEREGEREMFIQSFPSITSSF